MNIKIVDKYGYKELQNNTVIYGTFIECRFNSIINIMNINTVCPDFTRPSNLPRNHSSPFRFISTKYECWL